MFEQESLLKGNACAQLQTHIIMVKTPRKCRMDGYMYIIALHALSECKYDREKNMSGEPHGK